MERENMKSVPAPGSEGPNSASGRRKLAILLSAGFITVWAVAGLFGEKGGYTDALYEPDYTIQHLPADGPLAEAGFLQGDSVISVEGIPIEALGMYSRWPRSLRRLPGESIRMTVNRMGQPYTGTVVYRERPDWISRSILLRSLTPFVFLWAGVLAFLAFSDSLSLRLAGIGLAAGLTLPGPNLGTWNGVSGHVQVAAAVLWFLLLFRFFLFFPKPGRLAQSRTLLWLGLAPWMALLFCLALELTYHPRYYHSFGGLSSLLILAYGLLAFGGVSRAVLKSTWRESRSSGMAWVMGGLLAALIPNLVRVGGWFLAPGIDLPLSRYYSSLFALVPLALVLAVWQNRRSGEAGAPRADP